MIFMFRTRTWVPGRAVPWGLGAPGAPPRGSQGGVPAPNYKDQSHLSSTLWIRIKIDVDFDVDFDCFGIDLGSLLGLMLGSFWRLFRPKLVPEPSSDRLIFEKVFFHETV